MELRGATVNPEQIIIPRAAPYGPQTRIEWVEGFDLLAERPTYVPLNAVVCPYMPSAGRPMIYFAGSNGLASGKTLEERCVMPCAKWSSGTPPPSLTRPWTLRPR